MLLTALVFASNPEVHARIQRRCLNTGDINLFRSPDYRPTTADMIRLINSYCPEMVFIEMGDKDDAMKTTATLQANYPTLAILGVADDWKHERVLKTDGGYLRIITSTTAPEEFREAVFGVVNASRVPGPDNVIVFMPAKAGSGASTVALNVTGALTNKCGKSAVLIEADLHSGPAGMYLDLKPTHSIVDALEDSHRLEARWKDLVTPVQNFGILPACNINGLVPQVSPWAYQRLMSFTRNRYEHVIFDLPEVINQATEVIVAGAKAVYVVCTPEVPSLMLARKRCATLIDRGVKPESLKILLNRYSKDGPDPPSVSQILGYPIAQVIPNDYKSLWEANLKRRLVANTSVLGRALESFAWTLTGKAGAEAKVGRKILGLFSAA